MDVGATRRAVPSLGRAQARPPRATTNVATASLRKLLRANITRATRAGDRRDQTTVNLGGVAAATPPIGSFVRATSAKALMAADPGRGKPKPAESPVQRTSLDVAEWKRAHLRHCRTCTTDDATPLPERMVAPFCYYNDFDWRLKHGVYFHPCSCHPPPRAQSGCTPKQNRHWDPSVEEHPSD